MEHVPPKTQVLREKLGKGVGIKWGEGVGINPIGEGGSGGLRQLTLCSVQGAEDLLQNKRERLVHAVPGRARRRQNTENDCAGQGVAGPTGPGEMRWAPLWTTRARKMRMSEKGEGRLSDESRPRGDIIPAETLIHNGTAGDNGTAGGTLHQSSPHAWFRNQACENQFA